MLDVLKKSDDGRNSSLIGYLERLDANGQKSLLDLMGIEKQSRIETDKNP